MNKHLVIVGGGQAAAQLVQSSRQLGFEGNITLIGEESEAPYQRPPLSKKYLAGELERDRLFIKPPQFYAERGVELLLGTRAESIRTDSRQLRLSDDSRIDYDLLALATGAAPRRMDIPGTALTGVHYLRTVKDVDAIQARLKTSKRVVIVGAGYIGLEVAASCVARGAKVTVLEAAPRILGRVVCDTTADFYADYHKSRGVSIHCGAQVAEFLGDTQVTGVRTSADAVYDADCVIVGIGVTPNTQLAEAAGISCSNGICVDPYTRTDVKGVFALGDCTSHPHPWIGTRVRLESVQNAIEQGKSAASTMFAEPRAFTDVPWFWSDQYDLKLQIAGLALDYDQTIMRGDTRQRKFAVYYMQGKRLVAVDAVNSPKDFILAKRLLSAHAEPSPEAIADLEQDLSAFLPNS